MKWRLLLLALFLCPMLTHAGPIFTQPSPPSLAADPAHCSTTGAWYQKFYYNTVSNVWKYCSATDTWTTFGTNPGTGTVTNTGALTSNALMLGNGTTVIKAMSSLGTATTLLHGNASGAPSFSGVDLVNDVLANQGTATTLLHGNAAGQPSFGAVAIADLASVLGTGTKVVTSSATAPASNKCLEMDSSGNVVIAGANTVCGVGSVNPTSTKMPYNNGGVFADSPFTVSGGNVSTAGDVQAGSVTIPQGVSAQKLTLWQPSGSGAFYNAFQAANGLTGNVTWVLPTADSTGPFASDGAGNMSIAGTSGAGLYLRQTGPTITLPILQYYTVAALPAAASYNHQIAVVTDSATAGSCTSGSGSARALCYSNGVSWNPLGDGGGATIASVTNLLVGDGTGNASDAGIAAANVVRKDAANSGAAAMTLDMSASTTANAFKVPSGAGLTSGASGAIAYDTTAKSTKIRTNDADSVALGMSPTPAGSKCVHTSGATGLVVETAADCMDPTIAVVNNNTNSGTTAMTLDMSASTTANAFKVPVGAALTAGANGAIAYNSTGLSTHIRTNNADSIAIAIASAPAGSKCLHTSGTTGLVTETAGDCAGGGTLTNVAASLPVNQLVMGNTYPDTLTTTINTDSTAALLGVKTAGAANVDAGYKFGASAVSGFGGIGLTGTGFASGHAVNDTNYASKRYLMGYIDGNTYSVTNGGANNVIAGSFFAAATLTGAGISKYEAHASQSQVTGSSTVAVWQDYSSAPTVATGSTITRRNSFECDSVQGSGTVGTDVCFYANNGSGYGFVQDGTGVNYMRGKLAVSFQGSPTHQLDIGGTSHYAINAQKLAYYNQVATTGEGQAYELGTVVNSTAQAADIAQTTIQATGATSPGAGMYRVMIYIIVTQAATSSSTMPTACVQWTDADNSQVQNINVTASSTGNTLTTQASGIGVIYAKASTNITYGTGANCTGGTTYASSGATPMQYSLHIRTEKIN